MSKERKIRRSLRFQIVPEKTILMLDYVFADNPTEAEQKGREVYEIPETEAVMVQRISDVTNLPMRLN